MSRALAKKLYTPQEVAEMLRVGSAWVREVHREGLAHEVEPGVHLLIPRPTLERMRQYVAEPNCYNSPYRINFGDWLRSHGFPLSRVVYATGTSVAVRASRAKQATTPRAVQGDAGSVAEIADLKRRVSNLERERQAIVSGKVEQLTEEDSSDRKLAREKVGAWVYAQYPNPGDKEFRRTWTRIRHYFEASVGGVSESVYQHQLEANTWLRSIERSGYMKRFLETLPRILKRLSSELAPQSEHPELF